MKKWILTTCVASAVVLILTVSSHGQGNQTEMAERRQIVEEILETGASVARVDRAHEVNANQVFERRKLYRERRLEVESATNGLLPVQIRKTVEKGQRRGPTRSKSQSQEATGTELRSTL